MDDGGVLDFENELMEAFPKGLKLLYDDAIVLVPESDLDLALQYYEMGADSLGAVALVEPRTSCLAKVVFGKIFVVSGAVANRILRTSLG